MQLVGTAWNSYSRWRPGWIFTSRTFWPPESPPSGPGCVRICTSGPGGDQHGAGDSATAGSDAPDRAAPPPDQYGDDAAPDAVHRLAADRRRGADPDRRNRRPRALFPADRHDYRGGAGERWSRQPGA